MYLAFSLSFTYLWNRNVSSTFLIIYYTLESASHMTYPFSQAIIEDLTEKSCYRPAVSLAPSLKELATPDESAWSQSPPDTQTFNL